MAVKDSAELGINERYPLGEYSFRVERSAGTSPNYDKIEAICTKGGKNARKSIQIPSSAQLICWYVEANGDTASVYVNVEEKGDDWTCDPAREVSSAGLYLGTVNDRTFFKETSGRAIAFFQFEPNGYVGPELISTDADAVRYYYGNTHLGVEHQFDYLGLHWYENGNHHYMNPASYSAGVPPYYGPEDWPTVLASAGVQVTTDNKDYLVGRFAIEIEDAGGVGPGSDWTDPEDGGDSTYTLYVEVTGALSGRHNDPIVDPSYSYLPADKDTVKDYGCGGDGGHGGGGGAGASTVVVYKFATNQAGSKEITALARRHGYGSGGGKGGKGGDGCILVYY